MLARFLTLTLLVLIIFTTSSFSQSFYELNDKMVEEYQKQNYQEALQIGLLALEQAKIELGISHPDYLLELQNISDCYEALNNHPKSINIQKEQLKWYFNFGDTTSLEYGMVFNRLGILYYQL